MIRITTSSLPIGTVGEAYFAQLEAQVQPPADVVWSCGSSLPSKLTLDPSSGAISGICEASFFATPVFIVSTKETSEKDAKPLLLYIEDTENMLVGTVIAYAGALTDDTIKEAVENEGWLLCDGSAVSRTTYSELYAVVGGIYGSGDTVNTFNLPNYQGQFLRGVSANSGVDPDAASRTGQVNPNGNNGAAQGNNVGSFQADELISHNHTYTEFPGDRGGIASGSYWKAESSTTGNTGGDETRPKNVYVNYLVRFRK